MATSTIELKSGSGSQILFAGRIHANRTEMIIEREFLNKCWICPGWHPSVAAIVSVQREDYSLNVEIVQRAHKFPTKNCSSSFRDCAESKFHPKKYSFILLFLYYHGLFARATQNYWCFPQSMCSLRGWNGKTCKEISFYTQNCGFYCLKCPKNWHEQSLELADVGEAPTLSELLDQPHPSLLMNIWILVSN